MESVSLDLWFLALPPARSYNCTGSADTSWPGLDLSKKAVSLVGSGATTPHRIGRYNKRKLAVAVVLGRVLWMQLGRLQNQGDDTMLLAVSFHLARSALPCVH